MHSFSGLSSGFLLCALRTARQQSWLPGSDGLRYPSNCGKLLVIEVAQHPPLAGSGVQLAPRWGMGAWSARKMILWIIFSGKRAGRPRKSPIRNPVKLLFFSAIRRKKECQSGSPDWHSFHVCFYTTVTQSPALALPGSSTLAKMPSRGMTQSPAFSRMAQLKWHSLPIWVTSHRAVPILMRVPTGSS